MQSNDVFDILFLIGRPAAGKSEIIDYLKNTDPTSRRDRFHVGPFQEIDDFPMIWAWFEEDHILEQNSWPRLHTDSDGYFTEQYLWHVLIERLELEYWKQAKEDADFGKSQTAIVEFARGTEHGGFRTAFDHFTPDLLKRGTVLYIDVPFEESLRKNRKRFNPDKPHSILEHALPDDKLKRLYGKVDWKELSAGDPDYLHIKNVKVPYAVFPNGDDVTTGNNPELGRRLEQALALLWNRRNSHE